MSSREKNVFIGILVILVVSVGFLAFRSFVGLEEPVARGTYNVPVYVEQGGAKMVVESGGAIEIQSGGRIEITPGATVAFGDLSISGPLALTAPTTVATATPALVVDSLGLGVIFEARDAATPVASIYNGGDWDLHGNKFDLDVDNDTSLTVDTDDQIDIEIAGSDEYTITNSIFSFNSNELTLDTDLDTSITVDTDDQVDIEVGGSDVISFTASYATFSIPVSQWFADQTITDGLWVTPTANIMALDSGGAVTMTLGTAATIPNGFTLTLIGDDANTITINDTNIRTSDGNAATLGQFDVIVFVYQDSEWHEVSKSANS